MALGDTYATLAELQARVTPNKTPSADEIAAMTNALSVASRAIDAHCRRQFNKTETASARVYAPLSPVLAHVDDFHTTTDLALAIDLDGDGVYETTLAATDYRLAPLNGLRHGESGWPYWQVKTTPLGSYRLVCGVSLQVTAQWGWASVPSAIKEACLALAEETFKLKDAPFGVSMGFADFGPVRVRENPRVMAMLQPYRRQSVLVA